MRSLLVALQHLLPHHLLGRVVYALTRSRRRWLKDWLIGVFMRAYHPAMDDALEPDAHRYDSFNAFFTRSLRPGSRPTDPDRRGIVSPCDGTVSQAGWLRHGELLQAKHHYYSLEALLGGSSEWAQGLVGGGYATLYLAPYNYHRVHMPLDGRLRSAWHVPGRLFSVNPVTVERVPDIFARNERVVCCFDGERGPFAVILIGALLVGSMSTVWHGEVTPWRGARHAALTVLAPSTATPAWQPRGAELGRFNMGSTVVLLIGSELAGWSPELSSAAAVTVGRTIGSLRPTP